MSKNKNRSVEERIPLVSVVIPMYNAAKFIPQTLESLLYQTMTDFEVIVVDDCSTDSSVEVVEKFASSFAAEGIPLHLIGLPTNSAMPGVPRNIGIQFACGKYVTFLDSDDLLTETALEELSTLAEEFQADVVHTDTFLMLFGDKDISVCHRQKLPVPTAPTFEVTDIAQRIANWVNRGYNWESVTMFCRRRFLVGNQIKFPKLPNNEDMIFSFKILCMTEKFLRVPNITYIYRQRDNSVSLKQSFNFAAPFHKWLHVLNDGLNEFAQIMEPIEFFAENPNYRYAVLNFFLNEVLDIFGGFYVNRPAHVFDEFVRKEFQSENAEFIAQIFGTLNAQRVELAQLQAELKKFRKQ